MLIALLLGTSCNENRFRPAATTSPTPVWGVSVAILVDTSGSMAETIPSDPAHVRQAVARDALAEMLLATESYMKRHPNNVVEVGLFAFNHDFTPVVPIQPYDHDVIDRGFQKLPRADGGTAIGLALQRATRELARRNTNRRVILVVTDGINEHGIDPAKALENIHARRAEQAPMVHFVAFNVDPQKFAFLKKYDGEVLGATTGAELGAALDEIYRGKVLLEAEDPDAVAPPEKVTPGFVPGVGEVP